LGGFWLGVKGTRQRGPDHQAVPPRAGARRRVAEPLCRFRQGRHQASPAPDSFHAANDLIFGVENGAAIYLGARLAIEGALTVGVLFTHMSYKRQILEKVAQLIEKMIELRMLDLYLDRLRRKIFSLHSAENHPANLKFCD